MPREIGSYDKGEQDSKWRDLNLERVLPRWLKIIAHHPSSLVEN